MEFEKHLVHYEAACPRCGVLCRIRYFKFKNSPVWAPDRHIDTDGEPCSIGLEVRADDPITYACKIMEKAQAKLKAAHPHAYGEKQ